MMKVNKQTKLMMLTAAVLIVLAVICRMLGNSGFYRQPMGMIRSGIYIFMFVAWGVLLNGRIIHAELRRYMVSIAGLMSFWLLLRTLKYNFISQEDMPDLTRFVWYAYYIPMLIIPLLFV